MTGSGAEGGGEPLGSARDEAARLLDALSAWASGSLGTPGSAFSAVRDHLGAEGIATGAPECRLCPVCQAIGALRGLRPEVVEHLLDAGGSLLAALKAGVESQGQRPTSPRDPSPPPGSGHHHGGGRVEHIDIG